MGKCLWDTAALSFTVKYQIALLAKRNVFRHDNMNGAGVHQAFPLDIRKKTQGEKNSKLKKKTQTQAKNSTFRHFSKK